MHTDFFTVENVRGILVATLDPAITHYPPSLPPRSKLLSDWLVVARQLPLPMAFQLPVWDDDILQQFHSLGAVLDQQGFPMVICGLGEAAGPLLQKQEQFSLLQICPDLNSALEYLRVQAHTPRDDLWDTSVMFELPPPELALIDD